MEKVPLLSRDRGQREQKVLTSQILGQNLSLDAVFVPRASSKVHN